MAEVGKEHCLILDRALAMPLVSMQIRNSLNQSKSMLARAEMEMGQWVTRQIGHHFRWVTLVMGHCQ